MADAFNPGRSYEVGGFSYNPAEWRKKNPHTPSPIYKYKGKTYDLTKLQDYLRLHEVEFGSRQNVQNDIKTWNEYYAPTQWSENISEFIQDPAGNTIKNPLWSAPVKQGGMYNGQKVTYVKTPTKWSAPLDPSLRVETDSEFLLGKNSADNAYNNDVNARQRNLDLTNLNYGQSKLKLAQQRTQDLSGIDQRAARAGIAFSQGRLNARNRYETDFNDRAQQAYAANDQANSQFYNQNIDAAATRRQAIDQVRQNVIGKLSARDETEKIANPQIDWQNPTAQYQSLDQKTGKRYYIDPKTKKPAYG